MNKSDAINELAAALAKAQAEMKSASMSRVNPHFKSKYAPLNEVIEVTKALNKHGLSFVQPARVSADGVVEIETVLMHSSGQWLSETLGLKPQQNTPQGVGAAITYGRRFGLSSLIGIAADEDDDGEEATRPAPNGHARTVSQTDRHPADRFEELKQALLQAKDAAAFRSVTVAIAKAAEAKELNEGHLKLLRGIAATKQAGFGVAA